MKKMLFMAATAALALASCTSEDALNQAAQKPAEDGAVTFSAYTGRAVTRGTTLGEPITGLPDLIAQGGFGVYAYEQGTTAWNTYRASNTYPNFMYNQHVEGEMADLVSANWTYSPIKYYSNNEGALHSFFAYAPYNASVKSVFTTEGPAIRYQATDSYDLLYALPTTDKKKADIHEKIQFDFKHALSKVSFEASTFVDEVHGASHTASVVEEGTTVTLRSVKFVGNVPSKALMSLTTGNWTIEASEESAYEFCPADGKEFTHTIAGPLAVSSNNLVIPTAAANKVHIQVVYDVTTVDEDNPQNSSTITNTITSVEEFPLVKGTAYMFHLDLGLTSVKFNATAVDWAANQDVNVDLPNNHKYELVAVVNYATTAEVTAAASTTEDGVICYDAEVSAYKICNSHTWSDLTPTPVVVYSLNVNSEGKIQTGSDASLSASWVAPTPNAYYTFGGNLYQWK